MGSLLDYFKDLPDPRLDRKKEHDLTELIVIAIAAVISGAEDWNAIERFGQSKLDWLKTFLKLPGGIASHDTFNRVFGLLDAQAFGQRFLQWTQAICQLTEGEVVAIDGKALRASVDGPKGKSAIYLVSAWACGNGLVLAQRKVGEKSNEITAIPKLLEVLVLKGCIVTIDAIGCQKQIAHQIIEQEADYILALKANQPCLLADVQQSFALEKPAQTTLEIDLGHGRIEKRTCSLITQLGWVEKAADWPKLTTLIRIQSHTQEKASGKISTHCRFFISSLQADAQKINQAIRYSLFVLTGPLKTVYTRAWMWPFKRIKTEPALRMPIKTWPY